MTSDLPYVDTIADLRASDPAVVGNNVLLLGYYAAGDGGGGLFSWSASSVATDDDGMTIAASAVAPPIATGRWKRERDGLLSVRWFGARGDGTGNDRASIQKAIDYIGPLGADLDGFPEGNTVYFPPGEYVISAGSSAAGLTVINNNAMLLGDGGAPNGTKLLLDGPAAGILIEGAQGFPTPHEALARGARLSGLAIYKKPGGNPAQDAVVVHAAFVSISDCVIAGAARHGILIESGTSVSGALLGMTTAPSSTYFNSNGWRISNVNLLACGNMAGQGLSSNGAGVYIHGSDTNGGFGIGVFVESSNVGVHSGALGGSTWVSCYTEMNNLGFKDASAGISLYLGCYSEDVTAGSFSTTNQSSLVIGGSLVGLTEADERVGQKFSRLHFADPSHVDVGATYEVQVPGYIKSAIDISRKTATDSSTWCFSYEPTAVQGDHPITWKSWRWICRQTAAGLLSSVIDPYGAPFGWTHVDHPRGAGLPFIGAPLLNSNRRWSYRQTEVELAPGRNVIYLHGKTVNSGPAVYTADPAFWWEKAKTRVSIEAEVADYTVLASSDVRIGAYAFVVAPTGRNIAVQVFNGGSSAVTVTLVWHIETYVPGGDTGIW